MRISKGNKLEQQIADTLIEAGIKFLHESDYGANERRLDFFLPDYDIHIEVKWGMSPKDKGKARILRQIASEPNIILLKGQKAVDLFCKLIKGLKDGDTTKLNERELLG